MPDNLAHGDLFGAARQEVAAILAGRAVHPTPGLHLQQDVLQETFGDLIAFSQFTDGDRSPTAAFHQGEDGAQGVIGFPGEPHSTIAE